LPRRREAIFEDDEDRGLFPATLGEGVKRTGWHIHGYVPMANHDHLVVETPEANPVRGMTWFQTTYTNTTRYNARHRGSGHLFGGRYKAVPMEPDDPRCLRTQLSNRRLLPIAQGK
jgi:putative transposase